MHRIHIFLVEERQRKIQRPTNKKQSFLFFHLLFFFTTKKYSLLFFPPINYSHNTVRLRPIGLTKEDHRCAMPFSINILGRGKLDILSILMPEQGMGEGRAQRTADRLAHGDGARDGRERGDVVDERVADEEYGQQDVARRQRPAGAEPVRDPAARDGGEEPAETGHRHGHRDALGGQTDSSGEEDGAGRQKEAGAERLGEREDTHPALGAGRRDEVFQEPGCGRAEGRHEPSRVNDGMEMTEHRNGAVATPFTGREGARRKHPERLRAL